MDDLVVNDELLILVIDDQDTDGSGAVAKGLLDLGGKAALLDDLDSSLDFTGIGHGDQETVIPDVDEAVLLESRGEHGMQDDRWGWVGDNARLLAELLGEQINTEVSVLTGLGGGGNADDLGWAVLEDYEITDADVVAWDGEVGLSRGRNGSWWSWGGNALSGDELDGTLIPRQGVGLAGLGIVGSWVECGVQLGTEVLQVVVVEIRLLTHFLFLLDNNDFWNATTGLLWLLDSNADLLDVGWLGVVLSGNVDLRGADETTN
ncbi:hypothetical protein ABW19_dt0202522 [Dactylella cylindrospora]|nr:hypothetical protein ABW19_dt0202522 [Dactylella cylindrospora]